MKITKRSVSKINLFIKILGKNSDNYHEIETLFLPLDNPSDIIHLSDNENGIVIECEDRNVPCDSRNLCYKAAQQYADYANIIPSWKIEIEKNIPIAAGMGGGSSNAATVLNILQEKYNALEQKQIAEIAKNIGADVPFFLNPKPSTATGIGENLVPLNFQIPKLPIMIIIPRFPVSAKWAYDNKIIPKESSNLENLLNALKKEEIAEVANNLHNDLEYALFQKFPLLDILKQEINNQGAFKTIITGSGPTLFALFESQESLNLAKKNLNQNINFKII